MSKSTIGIIISRIIGFVIFLILIGVASLISIGVHNSTYLEIVSFFYENIKLLLTMTIIGTIGEIFWNFSFPFNVVAPIANAFLGKYIIIFLYELLDKVGLENLTQGYSVTSVSKWTFIIVLVVGYILIFKKMNEKHKKEENEDKERKKKEEEYIKEWEKIGERIKESVEKSVKSLSYAFKKKEKKKIKKK